MHDILPTTILETLHDRYVAGVADAEAFFDLHRADEDAVSGALGQSIAMREPIIFNTEKGRFIVKISYRKIRGRGQGAPERTYGADGLFQILVTDVLLGKTIRSKGLPFQSKINWRGSKKDLLNQAIKMQEHFGGGIVVDFAETGYKACTALAAIDGHGNRTTVDKAGNMRSLGQILGRDFLECTIGTQDLIFDPGNESFAIETLGKGVHLITTEIFSLGLNDEAQLDR